MKTEEFEKMNYIVPVYVTGRSLNGSYCILGYDIAHGCHVMLRGEVYSTLEEARESARELNKNTKPINIDDLYSNHHS